MKRRSLIQKMMFFVSLGVLQVHCDKEQKTVPTSPGSGEETLDLDLSDDMYANLRNVGGSLRATIEGIGPKVLIIRTSESTASVLSEVCTHASCPVNLPENGQILCACHNSLFDLDGSVVRGPATAPLPSWPAVVENNVIKITV